MSRGYTSRRIATAMQAPRPVETPDTDAATIYAQRWRRHDRKAHRVFNVLALDEQMAEEMGMLRLREHYNQNIFDWTLESSRPAGRITSHVWAVLQAEHPDETQLREETYADRMKGASV